MTIRFTCCLIPSRILSVAGLLLGLFGPSLPAQALSVVPMTSEIASSGSGTQMQFSVANENATPVPVEVQIYRMDIKENGAVNLTKADDDFIVFPYSLMIKPRSTQVFRVKWAREPLARSQSYIFSINQLPVALPSDATGVQLVFNINAIVTVAPQQGEANLILNSTQLIAGKDGKRYAAVTVENRGKRHALLSEGVIKLKGGTWSTTLSSAELKQALGLGLVQPGKTRRFTLPTIIPDNIQSITAEVIYEAHTR
jgi:P pilus assembly chaperone PapD